MRRRMVIMVQAEGKEYSREERTGQDEEEGCLLVSCLQINAVDKQI